MVILNIKGLSHERHMGSLVAGMKLAFKDVNLKEQIVDPIAPSTRRSSFRSFVRRHHKTPVRTGGISKPKMYRHAAVSYEATIAWNGLRR